MSKPYCGKSCEGCTYRDELGCPGCKAGPGKFWSCECALAKCCKEKGHETCETCSFYANCETRSERERIPEYRLKKQIDEADKAAKAAQKAAFLGKWLWLLFWLVVPATLAGFMTIDRIAQLVPALYLPGQLIGIICSAGYGFILLKLASEHHSYRISGICCLVITAIGWVITAVSGSGSAPPWILLLALLVLVVGLIGEYHEYMAHAGVLREVDGSLSQDWSRLWKWYVRTIAGIFGSLLIMLLIPMVGALALLVSVIGLGVVSIKKLIYIYRTAQLFRAYGVNSPGR